MSKKILISILVVLLGSLIFGRVALAQAPTPSGQAYTDMLRIIGQVNAVGSNQLSVKDRQGNEFKLGVTSQTKLRALMNGSEKLSDLQVGQWVVVQSIPTGENQWTAKGVLALPQGFDPNVKMDVRTKGRVTAVDTTKGTFTLHTSKQGDLVLQAASSTKYYGVINSLDQLKPNMVAAIGAKKQAAGNLLTIILVAQNPLSRHLGNVASVDPAANRFTIHTFFTNQDFTFTVNQDTRFNSKGHSVQGLKDLQPGMVVLVGAQEQAGGESLAKAVTAAGKRTSPPKPTSSTAG